MSSPAIRDLKDLGHDLFNSFAMGSKTRKDAWSLNGTKRNFFHFNESKLAVSADRRQCLRIEDAGGVLARLLNQTGKCVASAVAVVGDITSGRIFWGDHARHINREP